MQNKRLNKAKTFFAVLIFSVSIFSVFYVALEKNHQCSGEDCPVCFIFNLIERGFELFFISATVKNCKSSKRIFKPFICFISSYILKLNTLVSQKIRMNN
ncbi:MAG: hypothetical protein K6B17_03740 [Treponema sp.]|nr:hypothetical protein [Treponema sp.]